MKKLVILASVFLTSSALAQSSLPSLNELSTVRANGQSVWQLLIDNDSLLLKKDDGFYTAGNQIAHRDVLTTTTQSTAYGWIIGQELYTASDINLPPSRISPKDHPYAGWLHAGVFRETESAAGQGTRIAFDIGCMGPCAGGERSQKTLHRILQQPLPQGWSTELHNEWGAVVSGDYTPGRLLPLPNVDITPRLKARVGNIFTDASADLTLRAGQINTLPNQPASYGYIRGEAKAVGYNATLQGGYFANQKTGVHPKSWVGEIELGYAWQGEHYGLNASILRRSNEIKELSNGTGAQNFARIVISYLN